MGHCPFHLEEGLRVETVALCGRCCRGCIPLSSISLSLHLLCRIHSVENDLLDADVTALGSSIRLLYFETIWDQNMHSIGIDFTIKSLCLREC